MTKENEKTKTVTNETGLNSPSVIMSQNARTGMPDFTEVNQYLPLIASPSLILISLQDTAVSATVEPSGTMDLNKTHTAARTNQ